MKAPLRFMLGWLIWLLIFLAINYPMATIWLAVQAQPWWLPVMSALVALVLFAVLFVATLHRFWSWCDATRKPLDIEAP